MLAALQPLSVLAEAQTPATEQPTTVQSQPAPTTPPATEAQPVVTPAPAPAPVLPPKTYSYDSASGRWNSNEWTYDPAANQYTPTQTPAAAPVAAPVPAIVEPAPQAQIPPTSSKATTNTEVANALESLATTGTASVDRNTTGGSATSGDAKATATIINKFESSMTNANNKEAATFVSDVMGDVNGDILLQPMLLKAMLEANAAKESSNQTATSLTNDVKLGAKSGDASVSGNTSAGNATTGSANTVVDVVNLVNSMVAANQSFVGTVNIYGNLNGDILVAPDFIPQLLASNSGGGTPATSTLNSSDTKQIVNNVSLAAESGSALVSNNTKAGSATTGTADTNLVIFNLSGHEIVASNSLLVFVNVMGKWVGVIVDAPVGATAAAIGSGVTSHSAQAPSLTLTTANETVLTNNIALTAQSGNASVTGNTTAGNAVTGNATASANIANIANSNIGLSGWFGILFINVYGNWTGSFGIDTSAGNAKEPLVRDRSNKQKSVDQSRKKVIEFRPSSTVYAPTNIRVIDTRSAVAPSEVVNASSTVPEQKVTGATISDIPRSVRPIQDRHYVRTPLLMASIALAGGSIYVLRRQLF